jgi:hypothetical protein
MDHDAPECSFLAEMSERCEQMQALRTARALLADLQRAMNVKISAVLESKPTIEKL